MRNYFEKNTEWIVTNVLFLNQQFWNIGLENPDLDFKIFRFIFRTSAYQIKYGVFPPKAS